MAKRGRPAFKPSAAHRRTVEEMKSCGESENVIARSLKIDADTLRKHFSVELQDGLSNRRREVIGLLYKSARTGNVTAQKRLEEMTRVAGAAAEFEEGKPNSTQPAARPAARKPRLGKKEEADIAAQSAGEDSEWGDDLRTPATRPN